MAPERKPPAALDTKRAAAEALRAAADALDPPAASAAPADADVAHQPAAEAADALLRAARAEAERLHAEAEARAVALLEAARQEAAQVLEQARQEAEQQRHALSDEVQAARGELAELRAHSARLLVRLEQTRGKLVEALRDQASVPEAHPAGDVAREAPAPDLPRPDLPRPEPPQPERPGKSTVSGDLEIALPNSLDLMTVEVLMSLLQEQPGVSVGELRHDEAHMVVPVHAAAPFPLLPMLEQLPRVAGARFVPGPNGAAGRQGGRVEVELAAPRAG